MHERRLQILLDEPRYLGASDAVLAAVALAHGAEALVSADRAFTGIDGLNHVVPGEGGFEALLRG